MATISIIIPMLALLATFYQLHLQRVHNEKSLKPLGQITLGDRGKVISVHVYNNGLGPLIIHRLIFMKSDNIYSNIADCLDLDPKSYMRMSMDDLTERVILPNSYLTIFEKNLASHTEAEVDFIRSQLKPITLKVEARDIYDNKIIIQRGFQWFNRHTL